MSRRRAAGTTDAMCIVPYVKTDAASEYAYPLIATTNGSLTIVHRGAATITSGRTVVTTSGSSVQLTTASTTCFRVDVVADLGNTDAIVIGGSTVVAALGSQVGTAILPGNTPVSILIDDLSKLYIDAIVSGEALCFNYYAY